LFTQAAEKKYPPAWRQLGLCHAAGIGTPPDNAKAEECNLQAAQLGDAPAMFKLGEIYRLGGQNLRAALFWYLQGAEHGEVNAMREAGSILFSGNRSSSERETGKKWLQRAADAGDHAAAAKLGISVPALF
jgi:TPR repeat protein